MAMKRSTVPQEPGQALGVLAGESWRMGHFLSSSRITYQFFISITLLVVNGRSHGPVTADTRTGAGAVNRKMLRDVRC